jgi:Fe-S-cluster containining protein
MCKMCGRCCTDFSVCGVYLNQEKEFLKEYPFLRHSGLRYPYSKNPVPMFRCSRLVNLGNGKKICSDYENRPEFCRNHPVSERTRSLGCTAPLTKKTGF